jgi:hypothetical protein
MLGYIISDKETINVEEHEIKSFNILNKTDFNIFVIENNKVLYKNNIIYNAFLKNHIQVLEWFKNSGYLLRDYQEIINYACAYVMIFGNIQILDWIKNNGYKIKYTRHSFKTNFIQKLKFYSNNVNIKKIIKWSDNIIFIKTTKLKIKNKYLKGYQKN